jgi:hypothetical protein
MKFTKGSYDVNEINKLFSVSERVQVLPPADREQEIMFKRT